MSFTYQRQYRGKIEAVLLDWAGTTMDYGCMAPAVVFVEVYKRQGVPITMDEARAPMGAHKRVHIQRITELEADIGFGGSDRSSSKISWSELISASDTSVVAGPRSGSATPRLNSERSKSSPSSA